MNLKILTVLVCGGAALAGCVSQFEVTRETASSKSVEELCKAITAGAYNPSIADSGKIALGELYERKVFTNAEMLKIARLEAAPGMSEKAGLCAWGYYWYDVNTTITARGTKKQYVFGDGKYTSRKFLYSENGRVTAVQE